MAAAKKPKAKFHDPTQQAEGKAARWKNEPLEERHPSLTVHTKRPFNAEPSNEALQQMFTPKGQHYRRTHAPVPLVNASDYNVSVCILKDGSKKEDVIKRFSLNDLETMFGSERKEIGCTLMCTGNRRGEYNPFGQTAGLPWANGSISTAKWSGYPLGSLLKKCGIDRDEMIKNGFDFITFWGLEDYHISIPIKKGMDPCGDVLVVTHMNGEPLPRDHGFPLRMVVPGFVGSRAVKWLDRIVLMKHEIEGPHQTGIAYKQLGPNYREFGGIPKGIIDALPPIDEIPVTSAITGPENGSDLILGFDEKDNDMFEVRGYGYSGAGRAIARVDVSLNNGKRWDQAEIIRIDGQNIRSYKAWGWCQWIYKVKKSEIPQWMEMKHGSNNGLLHIVAKAVDDQYNQQPNDPESIWNIRGILNVSWPKITVNVKSKPKAKL